MTTFAIALHFPVDELTADDVAILTTRKAGTYPTRQEAFQAADKLCRELDAVGFQIREVPTC